MRPSETNTFLQNRVNGHVAFWHETLQIVHEQSQLVPQLLP